MFEIENGFCPKCGSVLPPAGISECVTCYGCKYLIKVSDFGKMKAEYSIYFNSAENIDMAKKSKITEDSTSGPVAERICRKCGHNLMSYAAMQLRSADEGQTVFYTCVKCKFTESENS